MPFRTSLARVTGSPAQVSISAKTIFKGGLTISEAQAEPSQPLASVTVTQYSPLLLTVVDSLGDTFCFPLSAIKKAKLEIEIDTGGRRNRTKKGG